MADEAKIERTTLTFNSSDRVSTIKAYLWWPHGSEPKVGVTEKKARPRGVVQIVHGMAEHITRYDAFARVLADAGYLVCGHDQISHGESSRPELYGCIPSRGGKQMLLNDIGTLRELVSDLVEAHTPFFLFGHSFGSFLARAYIARVAQGLSGAIICGTGFVPPATSKAGNVAASLCCKLMGDNAKVKFLQAMADGAYASAIPNAATPFDWLSHNEQNVRDYIADPACGFMFSAGGYATLTDLTAETCSLACAEKVPRDLPLLFISGAEDPVGDNGEGVRKAYELYLKAGCKDVSLKLYAGMRHEILNESGHEIVYHDLLSWLKEHA